MKKTYVILISYLPNPRIYKRIELAKTMGEVHLICWDRKVVMHFPPVVEGVSIHRIQIAGENNPLKRMLPYLRFSAEARRLLRSIDPDVIHVQGPDMLKIAADYRGPGGKRPKIIYEIPDLHPLQIEEQKTAFRKAAQRAVVALERSLCRKVDLLIVTSEKFSELYYAAMVPAEKTLFFPNVPDPEIFRSYRKKSPDTPMTVGFIGIIVYRSQLRHLIWAAEQCGMPLLIAGLEGEPREIEPLCRAYPRGEWFGKFNFARDAAELYGKCDIIYCVYETDVANARILLPNKLYEAIQCEVPILVARGTYLAEIVERWDVGLAVDCHDREDIARALRALQTDRGLYERLSGNCRRHQSDIRLEKYDRELRERIEAFWPEQAPSEAREDRRL